MTIVSQTKIGDKEKTHGRGKGKRGAVDNPIFKRAASELHRDEGGSGKESRERSRRPAVEGRIESEHKKSTRLGDGCFRCSGHPDV